MARRREFYTTGELAKLCAEKGREISTQYIRDLIRNGTLTGYRAGRDYMIERKGGTPAWIEKWTQK